MSSSDDVLKQNGIRQVKALIEIPFNSVYSYADNFFDKPEMTLGDKALKQQVSFMKSCYLKDITYENIVDSKFFYISNSKTKQKIAFSNRMSSRGELRGGDLRKIIDETKESDPNISLYDFLTHAVKSLRYSDLYQITKHLLCSDVARELNNGQSMSSLHFDLFTSLLLSHIEKIRVKNKNYAKLSPIEIRNSNRLKTKLLKGVDCNKLYDSSMALCLQLTLFQQKECYFKNIGFNSLANVTIQTHDRLVQQIHQYCQGLISLNQFMQQFQRIVLHSRDKMIFLVSQESQYVASLFSYSQQQCITVMMSQILNSLRNIHQSMHISNAGNDLLVFFRQASTKSIRQLNSNTCHKST